MKLTQAILVTLALLVATALSAKPVAVFTMVIGKVQVKEADGRWINALAGMKVSEKAEIQTALKGKAALQFVNGNLLNIAPGSIVSIDKVVAGNYGTATDVNLSMGKVTAVIAKVDNDKRNHFRVRTPTVVAGVRGSIQEVGYTPELGTSVRMLEHSADVVTNMGAKILVPQGGESQVGSSTVLTPDQVATRENSVVLGNPSQSNGEAEFLVHAQDPTFSTAASDFTFFFNFFDSFLDEIYNMGFTRIDFEKL